MGRQKVPPEDRKSAKVAFRVTQEQKDWIVINNIPISEVFRSVLQVLIRNPKFLDEVLNTDLNTEKKW